MQLAAVGHGEISEYERRRGGSGGGSGLYGLLNDKSLRPSLMITITCAMVQQFSGINNAFNFSSTFLTQNGIDNDTVALIAVLMNVGNVLVTVFSAFLMDGAGRKSLLLFSTLAMSVSIAALTIAMTHPGQPWTAPFAVLAVVAFVCSFGVGMGPVPWLLPAELFPSDKVRPLPSLQSRSIPWPRALALVLPSALPCGPYLHSHTRADSFGAHIACLFRWRPVQRWLLCAIGWPISALASSSSLLRLPSAAWPSCRSYWSCCRLPSSSLPGCQRREARLFSRY